MEQPKGFSLAGELPGGGAATSDQTCHEVMGREVVLTVKEQERRGVHSWKLLLKTLLNIKKCDLRDRTNWTNASYVPTLHSSRSKIQSLIFVHFPGS